MTPNEYVGFAIRTEAPVDQALLERAASVIRLDHAAKGMATEVGEFTDTLKKFVFYNKPLDVDNLKEELGDLCWYLALAADELEIELEDIMVANIAKLAARYPHKFTSEKALNRDLEAERKALG